MTAAPSLQSEVDILGSQQTNRSPGLSGFVARVDLSLFPDQSIDTVESELLKKIKRKVVDQDWQLLDELTDTFGAGYPADIAVIEEPTNGTREYFGVLRATDTLIQIQLAANPANSFDTNQ